jgi:L-ascorbate metabolism protein UlaG (beta-lactamase superfamily)
VCPTPLFCFGALGDAGVYSPIRTHTAREEVATTFTVTWLGHAAFSLDMDGVKVLIDPFLFGNPLSPISADEVEADYIVITHGHGDHVGDSVAISKRTGAPTISNVEVSKWLSGQGVQDAKGMNTGGGGEFEFGRLELTIAFHSSSLPDGSYGGMPNGVILTSKDGKRFYHPGDTALFGDMRLIGDKGIDFTALPIGGWYTMGPQDALRAVELIRPKAVMPMHYSTFPAIQVDAAAWAEEVRQKTSVQVVVLKPGEAYAL